MRSFLDTEIKRQREGRSTRIPNGGAQEWGCGIRPLSSVGAKGAESGGKGRQIQRPFHPDC
jgi:hypothetical protein